MKANTALGFILAGLALWLLQRHPIPPSRRTFAQLCAATVALLGLLTLSQDLFGWDLGIDQFLFKDTVTSPETSVPGRMSPISAFNFFLSGLALLLVDVETRRGHWPGQFLALLTTTTSFMAIVGYAYSAHALYDIEPYSSMALHSALAFAVLSLGVLAARPDRGLMVLLTADTAGGILARRLLPIAVFLPLVLGWLRLQGQQAGFYGLAFGLALFTLSNVVLLSVVVWWNARSLSRLDLERRQAERERERLRGEAKFRTLVESVAVGIVVVDEQARIVVINPHAEKLFGYSHQELRGKLVEELVPENLREKHVVHRSSYMAAPRMREMGPALNLRARRKDGTTFPVEIGLSPIETDDGTLVIATVQDITKRLEAEERTKHKAAELEAINKELEAFTYSVFHDLRAPLRHLDGFSQLLVEEHAAAMPEPVRRYLNRIRDGTRQMGQLLDDLLNFSRLGRQELNLQLTGLNSLVEEVIAGLQPEGAGRTVEWKIDPLPFVECDPALMKQVLSNLLSNAVKFTRPRERAVIEVGSLTQDAQPAIFVRDNGVGFSMNYADKLFGIFQRLHRQEDFEGTGVGLATVQRIIHKHGGRVWAEAEINRGATFYFTLPEAPAQLQPAQEVPDARTGR